MNIFHLHTDPKICAEYHCDKHVVKMILETAQMLSTAYRRNFGDNDDLYKTAYPKHPMTIWVGDSGANFFWSVRLLDQLLYQYTMRYNKVHKYDVQDSVKHFSTLNENSNLPEIPQTPFANATPYKDMNTIHAYRHFYRMDKSKFARWKYTDMPSWLLAT